MSIDEIDMELVYQDVKKLLEADTSGHSMDHVDRVYNLAMKFAGSEGADRQTVALAALLHDVDDYKLFGQESADELVNASSILDKYSVDQPAKQQVISIIRSMGYNRYLDGVRPDTLEGMVVSDADMCDAIGSIGILRTHAYALSKGNMFFDKSLPILDAEVDASAYRSDRKTHSAQHFFDKLLKIPSIMMTESGKAEAQRRQKIMTDFLAELFYEAGATDWQAHLDSQY